MITQLKLHGALQANTRLGLDKMAGLGDIASRLMTAAPAAEKTVLAPLMEQGVAKTVAAMPSYGRIAPTAKPVAPVWGDAVSQFPSLSALSKNRAVASRPAAVPGMAGTAAGTPLTKGLR